jgi:hypothetical protein
MANWKKVIVSGSDAHLAGITSSVLTNDNLVIAGVGGALENSGLTLTGTTLNIGGNSIVSTGASSVLTGSFAGTFSGSVVVDLENLTQGVGIVPFTYDGNLAQTVAISGAASLSNNILTKWDSTDGKFVNSSLTDNGTTITGTTSIQLTGANSNLSGSFSGSFAGNGAALNSIPNAALNNSTITLAAGTNGSGGPDAVALGETLTINGTNNEVDIVIGANALTIGLPQDVTITQDLTVNRNLTVLGTASFQNTTNLEVADRFVLFASGSNAAGDGGIVIQQATQNVGELFGYDSGLTRWGLTSSFTADQPSFTPDAFMAAVTTLASTNPNSSGPAARYSATGNIYVSSGDESIWMYS